MNIDALRAAGNVFRDEWGPAFGENQQALQTQTGNGIVVTVFNGDSKAHIIHGSNGFAHGDTNAPIQPNAFEMSGGNPRTRTLNPGTNGVGYPHDGGNGAGASLRREQFLTTMREHHVARQAIVVNGDYTERTGHTHRAEPGEDDDGQQCRPPDQVAATADPSAGHGEPVAAYERASASERAVSNGLRGRGTQSRRSC